MERVSEAIDDRRCELTERILNSEEHSADAVAAKLIIALWRHEGYDKLSKVALYDFDAVLKALQPSLTGCIAEDVARLFAIAPDSREA